MLRFIWTLSVYVRSFMRRFMPTNIVLDALRTRRGLKWGVPAILLAVVYFYAASVMTTLIEGGGSEWLYLVMAVCIWNALKFIVNGPLSLIQLARVRVLESRARRASIAIA